MNDQEITKLFRQVYGDNKPDIHQTYKLGKKLTRIAIIDFIDRLPFRWDGDKQTLTVDKRELLQLIEDATK